MNTTLLMEFRPHLARWLACVALGGWVLAVVGCGGGADSTSSTVTTPDPEAGPSATAPAEAPGELVMPVDDIPTSDEESDASEVNAPGETTPGSRSGFELPPDAAIPDSSSTQSGVSPEVRYATWNAIEEEVKASGKVTVVDLWSLACEPCLKEFPGLVDLHRAHGDHVQCVAVDLDYDGRKSRPPNFYEQNVVEFLTSVEASGFPVYISETPSDDVYAATDLISIPAVLVYDDTGNLIKTFVDAGPDAGFTYHEDVAPFIQSLAKP